MPLINREIPIIADDYIDIEFGTGCLKVTPAHDINDFNIGQKHNLEVIDTLNEDGTMSAAAQIYVGEDRFVARKKIIKELEKKASDRGVVIIYLVILLVIVWTAQLVAQRHGLGVFLTCRLHRKKVANLMGE